MVYRISRQEKEELNLSSWYRLVTFFYTSSFSNIYQTQCSRGCSTKYLPHSLVPSLAQWVILCENIFNKPSLRNHTSWGAEIKREGSPSPHLSYVMCNVFFWGGEGQSDVASWCSRHSKWCCFCAGKISGLKKFRKKLHKTPFKCIS